MPGQRWPPAHAACGSVVVCGTGALRRHAPVWGRPALGRGSGVERGRGAEGRSRLLSPAPPMFQMQLLDKFPIEGGQKDPKQRIIPFLPGKLRMALPAGYGATWEGPSLGQGRPAPQPGTLGRAGPGIFMLTAPQGVVGAPDCEGCCPPRVLSHHLRAIRGPGPCNC